MAYSPGGGGSSIAGSADVALSNVKSDDVLTYDASVSKWGNKGYAGGNIFVTTVGAPLPEGLANGTLIARYVNSGASAPVITTVGSMASAVSATAVTLVTTAAVLAGDTIAVSVTRGVAAGNTMGTMVATVSSGSVGAWTRASACRSGTYDTAMAVAHVIDTIPAGATITVATSGNGTYRTGVVAAGIHGVALGGPNATSGDDASGNLGNTSYGANTSGASLTVSTDAATTTPNTLVLGAFGIGANAGYTLAAGQTEIGRAVTGEGSADRGVMMGYKVATSIGVQSLALQSDPTSGMAGVVMALPLEGV